MGRVTLRAAAAVLGVLPAWLASCRHLPPDTKPPRQAEVLVKPPANDRRYDTPSYPEQAYKEKYDPRRNQNMAANPSMGRGAGMMSPGLPGNGI